MLKKEFLSRLKVKLTKYEDKGVEKVVQYYTEIIDDKLEAGMTEREAVESLGEIDDIVESLMCDLVERDDTKNARQKSQPPPQYYEEPIKKAKSEWFGESNKGYNKPEPDWFGESKKGNRKPEPDWFNESKKGNRKPEPDWFNESKKSYYYQDNSNDGKKSYGYQGKQNGQYGDKANVNVDEKGNIIIDAQSGDEKSFIKIKKDGSVQIDAIASTEKASVQVGKDGSVKIDGVDIDGKKGIKIKNGKINGIVQKKYQKSIQKAQKKKAKVLKKEAELAKTLNRSNTQRRARTSSRGYDIFHDYDLVGKTGYRLNAALNQRFPIGNIFILYSIFHYIVSIGKWFMASVMSIAALGTVGTVLVTSIMRYQGMGMLMLYGGAGLFAGAVVMIIAIIGFKITSGIQGLVDNAVKRKIDAIALEATYEEIN